MIAHIDPIHARALDGLDKVLRQQLAAVVEIIPGALHFVLSAAAKIRDERRKTHHVNQAV